MTMPKMKVMTILHSFRNRIIVYILINSIEFILRIIQIEYNPTFPSTKFNISSIILYNYNRVYKIVDRFNSYGLNLADYVQIFAY